MKILLIAGHGAGDPGATGNGYTEAVLAREVVSKLKSHLSPYADITVFDTNKKMSTYLITNSYNFKAYDYVFEVHFNAFKKESVSNGNIKGTEILVHSTEVNTNVEKAILDSICALGYTNRGIKHRSDLMVMNTCKGKQQVSYALLEVYFIDDIDDMKFYIAKKEETCKAIANGIIKGFGLKKTVTGTKNNTLDEDLNVLVKNGVINTPAYWKNKAPTVTYLPELIHNMAEKLR
jgi:N-acetylmuramoyl-L-alanine amidase